VDSVALGAQGPEEPAVPVRARRVPVRQPVLVDLLLRLAVLVPAHSAVLVPRPVPVDPLLEARPVPAHFDPAVPVELLLSRRSF
jgi:hypothetical protein